jgi:coniferyl-aldehyde dehydrogenase
VSTGSALDLAFIALRDASRHHPYPSLADRRAHLQALLAAIAENKYRIAEAIDADFGGRSVDETLQGEILPVLTFAKYARRNLRQWMRPERRWIALKYAFGSNRVVYQPLGVVGIIAPWNYPVALSLGPLVGALAAGNRAILRLSERVPKTAAVIGEILARALPDFVWMAPNDHASAERMTHLPFDRIVFTGSTRVGREVMRAAAENLTPVLLELGGKSPAIVHASYAPEKAARRIAWGKFFNAGQTCIAPDYALVHRSAMAAFAAALRKEIAALFPNAPDTPDYTAIIDDKQLAHFEALVGDAAAKGAMIVRVPETQVKSGRKVAPTIVAGATDEMLVLREEVFGPILPIRAYDDFEEVFAYLAARPRPLALYYFDDDRSRIGRMARETVSGGFAVNDAMLQFVQEALPFGGVGASGMGRYNGFEGFATMSNARAVYRPGFFNINRIVHPPYTKLMRFLLDRTTRRTPF